MKNDYMPSLFAPRAQKWNMISLLFSLFYFLPVIMSAEYLKLADWIKIFVSYAVFLGLYFWGLKSDSKNAIYPIAALIICCLYVSSFTPGSNALFGFAMFLTAYYFPLPKALWILALTIAAEIVAFALLRNYDFMFLGIAIFLSLALFINAVFVRKDLLHRFAEANDQEQIQQLATIAERERISRDLHDLLGHSLSSIALKADLAEKLLKAGQHDNAAKEIGEVAELSRSTLSEVRESVSGLKKTGLGAEFKLMCERLTSAGFEAECDNQLKADSILSPELETTFILLLKEACTNILRHSKGNKARLCLKQEQAELYMSIWDNGENAEIKPGNGTLGMQERCSAIAADYSISAGPEGTSVIIRKEISND
ncbi:MAG: sensor histidine kinase [Cellvibrionaceae bacterium]|nr:sensor histidine kinase [Cellvibrionaceae bacterium]